MGPKPIQHDKVYVDQNFWDTCYVNEAQNYLMSLILVVGKSCLGWKVGETGRTTEPVPNDQIIVEP